MPTSHFKKVAEGVAKPGQQTAAVPPPNRHVSVTSIALHSDQTAGHGPLGPGDRLGETGQIQRSADSGAMPEDLLCHLFKPVEGGAAAGQYDSRSRQSVELVFHEHPVDPDEEVAGALVENFGRESSRVDIVAVPTEARDLHRVDVETLAFEGGADLRA